MIIEKITLHDFGLYKGKQIIDLAPPSSRRPIVLFGGQNGAGKTTFLDALLLGLYGNMARCSNRGGLAYNKFLKNCINKSASTKDGASIEIQFKHRSNGSEDTYSIKRSWSQNGKGMREYFEVMKNDQFDTVLSDEWSNYVDEFMPSRIANLFFFDGEKIEEFADIANSSELLSTAINSLLGIDIIDKLSNDLVVLKRRKSASIKDAEAKKLIDVLENDIKKLENLRGQLFQDKGSKNNEKESLEKEINSLESDIREEGGDLLERQKDLEKNKEEIKLRIKSLEDDLRLIAAGPTPLMLVKDLLSSLKDQDEKEVQANNSINLIKALDDRDTKVIDKLKKSEIEPNLVRDIDKYLSKDRDDRQSSNKIEKYINLDQEGRNKLNALNSIFYEISDKANTISQELKLIYSNLDDIDRKLASVPDKEAVFNKIKERQELQFNLEKIEYEFKQIEEQIRKQGWEIEQKTRQLIKKIESSIEIEFKNEDNQRIIKHSNKVSETLDRFKKKVIRAHTERIAALILDSFKTLIRKKALIRNLSIDPESYMLELQGSDGRVLSPDRLSAGERQLLAVSILWGLAKASGRPLPAAIDTPLGRLDSSHRSHLVERYFPFASHQVFLFSTDEEIRDEYLDKLGPYIGHSYLLDYDDTKGYTEIKKGYFN